MSCILEIAKEWNIIHKNLINSEVPLSSIKIGSVEAEAISNYLQKLPITNKRSLWVAPGVYFSSEEGLNFGFVSNKFLIELLYEINNKGDIYE